MKYCVKFSQIKQENFYEYRVHMCHLKKYFQRQASLSINPEADYHLAVVIDQTVFLNNTVTMVLHGEVTL